MGGVVTKLRKPKTYALKIKYIPKLGESTSPIDFNEFTRRNVSFTIPPDSSIVWAVYVAGELLRFQFSENGDILFLRHISETTYPISFNAQITANFHDESVQASPVITVNLKKIAAYNRMCRSAFDAFEKKLATYPNLQDIKNFTIVITMNSVKHREPFDMSTVVPAGRCVIIRTSDSTEIMANEQMLHDEDFFEDLEYRKYTLNENGIKVYDAHPKMLARDLVEVLLFYSPFRHCGCPRVLGTFYRLIDECQCYVLELPLSLYWAQMSGDVGALVSEAENCEKKIFKYAPKRAIDFDERPDYSQHIPRKNTHSLFTKKIAP